jgi:PIN domain nuclease of toxin-antitoxin system
MNLLLDTHIVISILDLTLEKRFPQFAPILRNISNHNYISTVSLWEIAIKVRTGKLEMKTPLDEMASTLKQQQVTIIMMTSEHAVAEPIPLPPTRDPFDRLLLTQAQIEGMRFVNIDSALSDHPLCLRV